MVSNQSYESIDTVFTYPKYDDQVYCSSCGFAFIKDAHSKLQECETCMTSKLQYLTISIV